MERLQAPGACWHSPGHGDARLVLVLATVPYARSSLNGPKPCDYPMQNELTRDLISLEHSNLQGNPAPLHLTLLKPHS